MWKPGQIVTIDHKVYRVVKGQFGYTILCPTHTTQEVSNDSSCLFSRFAQYNGSNKLLFWILLFAYILGFVGTKVIMYLC